MLLEETTTASSATDTLFSLVVYGCIMSPDSRKPHNFLNNECYCICLVRKMYKTFVVKLGRLNCAALVKYVLIPTL